MIRRDSRVRRFGRSLAFVGAVAVTGSGAVAQQSPSYAASMTLANSNPRAADFADFNGDGRLDVALACGSNPTILVFLGDGYGGFEVAGTATFPVSSEDVIAEQLDGDGIPDLAITRANSVQVLRGDGVGGLITGPSFVTGAQPRALAAGDFDGDADIDLFSCNVQAATVTVARRNAAFTYTVVSTLAFGGQLRDVEVADVTGDGVLDVVVVDAAQIAGQPNGRVVVQRGLGNGSFVPHSVIAPSGFLGALDQLAIVDIDADGDRDLIGGAGAGIAVPLRNSGSGSFVQDPLVGSTPFSAGRLTIGDVDEDGDADLVTFDEFGGMGLVPHLNDGSGAFPVAMPKTYVPGAPAAMLLARVDGDRHVDALVAVENSSAFFTFRGTGVGTFDVPAASPPVSNSNLHTLALHDLDNDGDLDVARTRAINFNPFVDTLLNNGGFPAVPTTSVPSPFVSAAIVVGDITGDGFVDALVGDRFFSPPTIQRFANDGAGGLVAGVPIPLGLPTGTLKDIELADLDADADLDLVLTTTAPNRVVVYHQIGGVFGAPNITSHPFISGASVDVDDVTGDGIPDIVAAAGGGDSSRC
ncbi:MAG: VCBS repeat-containing protein [Planctomycetes bacterium]|nr:VCBS repeat-containing protein [Planctomycetota bacterium]